MIPSMAGEIRLTRTCLFARVGVKTTCNAKEISGSGYLVNDAVSMVRLRSHHDRHFERSRRATGHHLQYATTKTEIQYPIIILVNHGTAGEAEILAAALQAHSRAIII